MVLQNIYGLLLNYMALQPTKIQCNSLVHCTLVKNHCFCIIEHGNAIQFYCILYLSFTQSPIISVSLSLSMALKPFGPWPLFSVS
jgi:hypothetical protein